MGNRPLLTINRRLSARAITWLLLTAILALACVLRFWRLDLAQFEEDQADLMVWTVRALHTGDFHGVAYSIGLDQPPLPIYLFLVPAAFSSDPVWVTALIGLGDLAGVWACWRLGGLLFGPGAGLVAALLYACSPSSIISARRIWAQSWVAPLSALTLLFLVQFLRARRARDFALALYFGAAMMQMHPATLYFVPVMAAVAVWRWRDLRLKPIAVALALALLGLVPYLVDEVRRGLPNVRLLLDFVGRPKAFDLSAVALCLELTGGAGYWVVTHLGGPLLPALHLDLGWPGLVIVALFLASPLALWERVGVRAWCGSGYEIPAPRPAPGGRAGQAEPCPSWRGSQAAGSESLLVLAWLASPVVFSLRHQIALHDSYLYAFYPGALVCVAGLAACAWRRRGRWAGVARWGVALPLGAACVVQVADFPRFLALADSRESRPYYGIPLRYSREAGAAALAAAGPGHWAYFVTNDGRGLEYFAPGLSLRRFDGSHALVFPPTSTPGRVLYVVRDDDTPAQRALARLLPDQRLPAPATPRGETPYVLYLVDPALARQRADAEGRTAASGAFTPGLRARDAALPRSARAGEALQVSFDWEIGEQAVGVGEIDQFAHLLDGAGQRLAGADFRAFPSFLWRPGERVRTWFDLRLPPDATPGVGRLTVGFARAQGGQPLPAVDGSGRPVGNELPVGRVRVRPAREAVPAFRRPVDAAFAGVGRLLGFTLERRPEALGVELVWQADQAPANDYTVSVQLLDAAGKLVAQDDSQPDHGRLPTSFWDPGDRVADGHRLALPAGATGAYTLVASLYLAPNGARLPVTQDGAPRADSAARLATVVIG